MSTNEEISGWLNKQHEWIREAAHRILKEGGIDDRDIADLVDLVKMAEPKEKVPHSFPTLSGGAGGTIDLRLDSMGPVVGIDALNPRVPLKFGDGNLSVVYGTNGSGKSGYTRIISKACGKPHSVDLKPDVYKGIPTRQECAFNYTTRGIKKNCVWVANAHPVEDLKPVDVFDTECGRIYLEKDTHLSYEPPELTLFSDLVEACKLVDAALSAEQSKLVRKLPEIPVQHANTVAGKAYAALSKDTAPAIVSEMVTWTTADETALQEQRDRLKVADPAAAARKKRAEKAQIDAIRAALQHGINALSDDALDEIRRLKTAAVDKRRMVKEGAQAMGSVAKLDGVASGTWKAMWEAARTYSTSVAYPDLPFPHTEIGARCVLCHQDLNQESRRRLEEFEEFVKGALEAEASAAERALEEGLKRIPSRPTPDAVVPAIQAAGINEELQGAIEFAWTAIDPILTSLQAGEIPAAPPVLGAEITVLPAKLEELATAAQNAADDLDADAKSLDRTQALKAVAELEGKKWVAEQAGAVGAEVDRLKKWAKYEEWKRKTTTTGISRKAGELSEVLITEAYVKRFNDELKKLGAHRIQVELVRTATSYGRSKHGLRLQDVTDEKVRVSEVLSEGERRIVALAAFVADVTGRKTKAPFVFDDPISSLDQIFEEKVISRLVELSKDRQVLVFTHRLSFLGIMNDMASEGLHDVHIRRETWGTGQPGEVPLFGKKPDKALNSLKGERVVKARKAYETDGYESYYPLAKAICSDFRILCERIVETVFLADVVQRHRRAVNTKGKIGNLAKITASDCNLIDELMTKYSCYEHSQSDEAPVDVPEPEEIEKDIDRMVEWHKEFTARTFSVATMK